MTEEARRFVSDLVWNDAISRSCSPPTTAIVNADLAGIYGVPAPGSRVRARRLPGRLGARRPARPGAVPGAHRQTRRDVADRARALRARAVPLPARCRSAARREHQSAAGHAKPSRRPIASAWPSTPLNKSCASCHNLIDPIGFGLEKFDAIGARRDKLQLRFFGERRRPRSTSPKTVELDLDTTGYVAGHRELEVHVAQGTGRGAGAQPAVPGVRGEAVFPLYRRADAKRPATGR